MGYPMTYDRFIHRNLLQGSYGDKLIENTSRDIIAGDLRRLEKDTLDQNHVPMYAAFTEISEDQVRKIFEAFFHGVPSEWWLQYQDELRNRGIKWQAWPDIQG